MRPDQGPSISIAQALQTATASGLERIDAQQLVLLALQRDFNDRAWLLAHDDEPLPADAQTRFNALWRRRQQGEPFAYIAGRRAFFGLDLLVDARVLVPRPDTEVLVEWALEKIGAFPPDGQGRFLDLGTGSGAIALAVKSQRQDLEVSATDASAGALVVARTNARRLGLDVAFHAGHWLGAVPGRHFDVIASNPPYIAQSDPHLAALTHEPVSALTAGRDGLADLRQIVAGSPGALHPGGWLLLEHGHDQAEAVCRLLEAAGFGQIGSRMDLAGIARCSGGQWPHG